MDAISELFLHKSPSFDLSTPQGAFLALLRECRRVTKGGHPVPTDAYLTIANEALTERHAEILESLADPSMPIWDRETIREAEQYLGMAIEALQARLTEITASNMTRTPARVRPLCYSRLLIAYLDTLEVYDDELFSHLGFEDVPESE